MQALEIQSFAKMAFLMAISGASVMGAGHASAAVNASLIATPSTLTAGSTTDLILNLTALADSGYFNAALVDYSFSLDFGDGSAAALLTGSNSQVIVSHTYDLADSYMATLSGSATYSQQSTHLGVVGTEVYWCGWNFCHRDVIGPITTTHTLSSQIGANTGLLVTSVPEPETYGMLLAGLALVGIAARRQRISVVPSPQPV